MLTEQQRASLRKVARKPYHPELGKENPRLEEVISTLKAESPESFLFDSDLPKRRFFHEPISVIPFLTSEKDKL